MGGTCGTVNVSLDRKRPELGQIGIYFALFPHFGPGPAESAILAKAGPGVLTSGLSWWFTYLFGPNLDKHDLLLIDDRGRGLSAAIDCPDLQHGTAPYEQSVAECAAQLGKAASCYGTGDIAQDTDDVRAALGYEKIDYYGFSYGGVDAASYATRFPQHMRSLVLDSPVATRPEEFQFERYRTAASPRMIRLVCERSPNCAIDHPFAEFELNTLIWTFRMHPIEGDAYDANGNLKHVRVDEGNFLTHIVINPLGNMTNIGEVLAAGAALRQGDPKPLLRLEAEGYWAVQAESGDATVVSQGAKAASMAADFRVPWNWQTPVWQREEAYSRALAKLPVTYFWPFSKEAGTRPEIDFIHAYLNWEEPTPFLAGVPDYPMFPKVPTLVLGGDLDNWCPLEESRKVAAQSPGRVMFGLPSPGTARFRNALLAWCPGSSRPSKREM
jgi:pimeloyl-ACP methyl ester carboxylesterase